MTDVAYTRRRVLKMKLPGRMKRGRPKRRFMDAVTEDNAGGYGDR